MDLLKTYERLGCIDPISDIPAWDKARQEFLHELKKADRRLKKADRRDTPIKPVGRFDGNETIVYCPTCNKYSFDLTQYEWARTYCGRCGQAIDWSDTE